MRQADWKGWALSLLRIVSAFTYSLHGWQKWFGLFGGTGGHAVGSPALSHLAGGIETIGGALMMVGLFTRPVAFIASGEMAVAYFLRHVPRGLLPIQNSGEPAVLLCFVFLYLAAAGGGPLSLDRLVRRK